MAVNKSKHGELRNIAALETLVLVGRLGSITEAARRLGVTQQAVSARLHALEQSVGRPLLTRGPSGRALTADGRVVNDAAVAILQAVDKLDAAVDSVRNERSVLRTAASYTVAEYLIPHWLMKLSLTYGSASTQVTVTAVNSATVFEEVRVGLHDVGFVETPDIPDDLHHRKVGRDELVVVVAPTHPWAGLGGQAISMAELAATALVCREAGSGTRCSYERLVSSHDPALRPAEPALELPTTAAVKNAVSCGFAPAVLSLLSVREDLQFGRLHRVRIDSRPLLRDISAVWPAAVKELPAAARQLITVAASRN
ncbi:LysR family transcriptional regulator [Mycobacterium sp. SMC-4]|uniref:LysR family transcriptional regulator n=1 Tax=Mycobacterium sp. SMC-4 TaxID=2857059 RepID=UPI003D034980